MYQMLEETYSYIYQEGDRTLKIHNRKEARENVQRLERFVKLSLVEAQGGVRSVFILVPTIRRLVLLLLILS